MNRTRLVLPLGTVTLKRKANGVSLPDILKKLIEILNRKIADCET